MPYSNNFSDINNIDISNKNMNNTLSLYIIPFLLYNILRVISLLLGPYKLAVSEEPYTTN